MIIRKIYLYKYVRYLIALAGAISLTLSLVFLVSVLSWGSNYESGTGIVIEANGRSSVIEYEYAGSIYLVNEDVDSLDDERTVGEIVEIQINKNDSDRTTTSSQVEYLKIFAVFLLFTVLFFCIFMFTSSNKALKR